MARFGKGLRLPRTPQPDHFLRCECSTCHQTVSSPLRRLITAPPLCADGMHISPSPTPCISATLANNYALNSTAVDHLPFAGGTTHERRWAARCNHVTGRISRRIGSVCHSTANWTTSTFKITPPQLSPLTARHLTTACALCHVNNNYSGTPANRLLPVATPWSIRTGKRNHLSGLPNHVTLAYPTTCASCPYDCHLARAVFDHSTTDSPWSARTSPRLAPCVTSLRLCLRWIATVAILRHGRAPRRLGGQVPITLPRKPAPSASPQPPAPRATTPWPYWLGATFTHKFFKHQSRQLGRDLRKSAIPALQHVYAFSSAPRCHGE